MTFEDGYAEWSGAMFSILRDAGVKLFCYVPDTGSNSLISLAEKDNETRTILLTTEEEGVAICAGADLVGERGIICMQSSGVGNCPNYLSLVSGARFPLLMLVTMRGDYGEQNPWQYPMGRAVEPILKAMEVSMFKVENRNEIEEATVAALDTTEKGTQSAAIILSQKFLGAKGF
jgi:sulfopyruvate decarboxylase alpha subunit